MPQTPPPSAPANDAWFHELVTWADANQIPADKLTYLDLENNQFTHLPESIGQLHQLTVHLSRNQIRCLPASLQQRLGQG